MTKHGHLVAEDWGQRNDQERQANGQFSQHDPQMAHDWFSQHQTHPPAGFRDGDQLSADQESWLREGAPLGKDLRKRVHPAAPDLYRQLPPPPPRHRYVAVGGPIAPVGPNFNVKAVIHLH